MSEISQEEIQRLKWEFEAVPHNRMMQSILANPDGTGIYRNRLKRSAAQMDPHYFNVKPGPDVKVTDQKKSGRCWEFAGNNVIRRKIIEKFNLPMDWQISQSFFFFWDKFERLNYNMSRIALTTHLPVDDRTVQCLLADPTCDGGQWDMFSNIVEKYGMVPKSVFNESFASSTTLRMNILLSSLFRRTAKLVRSLSHADLQKDLEECLKTFRHEAFNILCRYLGTPPSTFDWEYYDKGGKYHRVSELTPQSFFEEYAEFSLDQYVCFINDPRNPYYKYYTVDHLGNMVGGRPVLYFNVPIDEMKNMVKKSLTGRKTYWDGTQVEQRQSGEKEQGEKEQGEQEQEQGKGEVVWFGCDVGKQCNGTLLDDKADQREELFGFNIMSTSKKDRLIYGDSLMTHAMVICGLNMDEVSGKVCRYRVENSWGSKGETGGFYCMSDTWFDEWVYEIVVNKAYCSPEMIERMNEAAKEGPPTPFPLWDPMGSLA